MHHLGGANALFVLVLQMHNALFVLAVHSTRFCVLYVLSKTTTKATSCNDSAYLTNNR